METIKQDWKGESVAIIATGPSIIGFDLDRIKSDHIIAVNDAYKLRDGIDLMYAADRPWYEHNEFCTGFNGERWTQNRGGSLWSKAAEENGLKVIVSETGKGLSDDPKKIYAGYNSGYQALNIAYLKGAATIYLIGFDCCVIGGKRHYFGDHPGKMNKKSPYNLFINAFQSAKDQLLLKSVKVFNCSDESKITCFPFLKSNQEIK